LLSLVERGGFDKKTFEWRIQNYYHIPAIEEIADDPNLLTEILRDLIWKHGVPISIEEVARLIRPGW
jgi:hypothetical protein